MKKLLPVMLFVFCLLTACSSFGGTWISISGKDDKGCYSKIRFLEKNYIEVKGGEEDLGDVRTYKKVGKDLYTFESKLSAILLEMKIDGDKLFIKDGNDTMCMYQKTK